MRQLIHSGILFPKYEPKGFKITAQGKPVVLSPQQEEMAVAWVRKLGTEYVEDPIFVKNFFGDFCQAFGLNHKVSPKDFDFSEIVSYVEEDRARKLSMDKEEKKRLAAERKTIREANKVKYGQAVVDGEGRSWQLHGRAFLHLHGARQTPVEREMEGRSIGARRNSESLIGGA